jgi:hypothetical protein
MLFKTPPNPPQYPYLSEIILIAGVFATLVTLYFSPELGRPLRVVLSKFSKRFLVSLLTSVILLSLGFWLLSINHPTEVKPQPAIILHPPLISDEPNSTIILPPPNYTQPEVIPPPWYASLWPLFIALGLGFLGFTIYSLKKP